MKTLGCLCVFIFLMIPTIGLGSEAVIIGSIKQVEGNASVLRQDKLLPAQEGLKLFENDTLQTGTDGSMGIIFRDNSVLSLGPNSKIVIDQFIFSPIESRFGFIARILRGTAAYISGEIGKLSPESARFETPVATIGLRGTRFAVKIVGD